MRGKRTLIVEDDYYLAYDLKADIEAVGGVAIGPFATVREALQVSHESVDAAVLNAEVRDGFTYPLAARLRASNVRVVFATDVHPRNGPKDLQSCPWLPKLYLPSQIIWLFRTISTD